MCFCSAKPFSVWLSCTRYRICPRMAHDRRYPLLHSQASCSCADEQVDEGMADHTLGIIRTLTRMRPTRSRVDTADHTLGIIQVVPVGVMRVCLRLAWPVGDIVCCHVDCLLFHDLNVLIIVCLKIAVGASNIGDLVV